MTSCVHENQEMEQVRGLQIDKSRRSVACSWTDRSRTPRRV